MSRLFVAALVLLAAVAGLLGAATWNRGGDPQTIVLTERELLLVDSARGGTDASMELRVRWQSRDDPQDARLWLGDTALRSLGFTTGVPAGAPEAADVYGRSLPRLAWVAFEYDGPAWRQIERQRQMVAGGGDGPWLAPSRLVPVDAAVDPDGLRRRYEGRPVVVLPAVVGLRYLNDPRQGPSVWGVVRELVAGRVTIPHRFRERLRGLAARPAGPDAPPRFEVVLRVGRLGAPWVEDVRVTRAAPSQSS